jgi:hypothetical protein
MVGGISFLRPGRELTSDVTKANTKILYTFCIRFGLLLLAVKNTSFFSNMVQVFSWAN